MTTARSTAATPTAGHFDLVVFAATPGGIACAVRAAREGLRVLLVEPSAHVGGMWASGVQVFDTRYAGHRCPILTEFVARLAEYYRTRHGSGSPQHALACFGDPSRHGERPRYEPQAAESIFRDILGETTGVRLQQGYRPGNVNKDGTTVQSVHFVPARPGLEGFRVSATVFVDASYEADLAAAAGAAFRTGRESREEFGEPHAGRHFTTIEPIGDAGHSLARRLNLHFFNRTSRQAFSGSTGAADRAIQAYTVRLVLTDQEENRRPVARPPRYVRETYLGVLDRAADAHQRSYPLSSHLLHGSLESLRFAANMPNGKMDWLGGNLVGGNHDYPTATLPRRQEIYRAHMDHALGLLHFLQDDPAVPLAVREHTRQWGLARDEYRNHDNLPPLMYVREARRLAGKHVFTEHDALRHPKHGRTPIRADAVAFAEWPMDSHDCNPVRQRGSCNDGEFILAEQTLPSQIPYRCLLSDAADNLLVPVCMSATHVGWGTMRLEPVFMHTGEAAGVAAALCVRDSLSPSKLPGCELQWQLLQRQIGVTYFADLDLSSKESWVRDIQFLGSRGFFGSYHASPDAPLDPVRAQAWPGALACWLEGEKNPDDIARAITAPSATTLGLRQLAPHTPAAALLRRCGWNEKTPRTVRDAAQVFGAALREAEAVGIPA